MDDDNTLIELTAGIVSAYVGKNAVSPSGITALVRDVHAALSAATKPAAPAAVPQEPAVSVRRSVTPDHIICLECGKRFKSLKRHLSADHELGPDAYRAKRGFGRTIQWSRLATRRSARSWPRTSAWARGLNPRRRRRERASEASTLPPPHLRARLLPCMGGMDPIAPGSEPGKPVVACRLSR